MCIEKKHDGNCTRMQLAMIIKSWKQHPSKQLLCRHLLHAKIIQIKRTRHAGHCWRSKDKPVSDVLLWTPSQGQAGAGRPDRTWKSDLTDKMKRSFFQAAVVSILLYGCTTWTLTKRLEKKLDDNYTRMLRVILNKSWRHDRNSNYLLRCHRPTR